MKTTLPKLVVLIAFLYSIFVVYNQFLFFGLSYDESLFINAAIGKDQTTFISKHWHGTPIMVMEYIGALKSWIYYPIFKIFGVNIYSIRLPMVLLMYINFYLMYKITLIKFDKILAISLLVLIFTDFTFINLHKIDHGPNAIETFIKLLALYFICKKFSYKNSLIVGIILLIGVFNKLNFIWFVNAVFGTYIICQILLNPLNNTIQLNWKNLLKKNFIFHLLLYFSVLAFFIFIIKIQNISPNQPRDFGLFIEQIQVQFNLMVFTILNYRYEYILGWASNVPIIFYTGIVVMFTVLALNIFWLAKRNSNYISHFQALILTAIIAVQYFYTKEASNIWHVAMMYPFVQLIVLSSVYILSEKRSTILVGFVAIWLSFNIFAFYNFERKVSTNCYFWLYEPSIYRLIDYTQNRPEKNVISLGYGIHSQLLVLDKKGKSYLELIGNAGNEDFNGMLNANLNYVADIDNVIVVENLKSNLDKKRMNFHIMENLLKAKNLRMDSLKVVNEGCGNGLYNIFKIKKLTNTEAK